MAENDNPLLASEAPEPRTLGQRIGRFFGLTIVNGIIGTAIGAAVGGAWNAGANLIGSATPAEPMPGGDVKAQTLMPTPDAPAAFGSALGPAALGLTGVENTVTVTPDVVGTGVAEAAVTPTPIPPAVDNPIPVGGTAPAPRAVDTTPVIDSNPGVLKPGPDAGTEVSSTRAAAPTMTGGSGSYAGGAPRTTFNADSVASEPKPLRVVSTDGTTVMPVANERPALDNNTAVASGANGPSAWDGAKTGMKYGAGIGAGVGALKSMIVGPHTQREHDRRIAAAQVPGQGPTPTT